MARAMIRAFEVLERHDCISVADDPRASRVRLENEMTSEAMRDRDLPQDHKLFWTALFLCSVGLPNEPIYLEKHE